MLILLVNCLQDREGSKFSVWCPLYYIKSSMVQRSNFYIFILVHRIYNTFPDLGVKKKSRVKFWGFQHVLSGSFMLTFTLLSGGFREWQLNCFLRLEFVFFGFVNFVWGQLDGGGDQLTTFHLYFCILYFQFLYFCILYFAFCVRSTGWWWGGSTDNLYNL